MLNSTIRFLKIRYLLSAWLMLLLLFPVFGAGAGAKEEAKKPAVLFR